MKRISSEHYCFIFNNIYQNNDNIESGFPTTSGKIPPTSGSSDWPKWDPHMTYMRVASGECGHLCLGLRVVEKYKGPIIGRGGGSYKTIGGDGDFYPYKRDTEFLLAIL